jgi:hypothetical protein
MNNFYMQLLEIVQIVIKLVLAFISAKLFAYALNGSQRKMVESHLLTSALLSALLMILLKELHQLYYFGYFITGIMALLVGFVIGRRGRKQPELPLLPVLYAIMTGTLLGLGFYRIAILGIIFGVFAFWMYGIGKIK